MIRKKKTVLEHCSTLFITSKGKPLSFNIKNSNIKKEQELVKKFLSLKKPGEAILAAYFIEMGLRENSSSMDRIIEHFGDNTSELDQINHLIETLTERGLLVKKYVRRRLRYSIRKEIFIHYRVLDAVLNNNPTLLNPPKVESILDFLQEYEELIEMKITDEINTDTLLAETDMLCQSNSSLLLVEAMKNDRMKSEEKVILLTSMIQLFKQGKNDVDLDQIIGDLFDESADQFRLRKQSRNGELLILKNNYLQRKKDELRFGNYVVIDKRGEDIFFSEGLTPKVQFAPEICRVEHFDQLNDEKLFYNPSELDQLELIENVMEESKMTRLVSGLKTNGIATGLSVMLHGKPGTGKTAVVKQWAKSSQRMLLWVEVNKIKSPWVGETEQRMDKAFKEYDMASRLYQKKPILLFNEADAILGTRHDSTRPAEQMMNSLQNLLLQRLEDFEGIFIATTNLPQNLDPAFDRRFLFKIQLNNPEYEVSKNILSYKFPQLENNFINMLIQKVKLNGAQWSNIQKKSKIMELINGKPISNNDILEWALKEGESDYRKKSCLIGFNSDKN